MDDAAKKQYEHIADWRSIIVPEDEDLLEELKRSDLDAMNMAMTIKNRQEQPMLLVNNRMLNHGFYFDKGEIMQKAITDNTKLLVSVVGYQEVDDQYELKESC